jgi:hypothetical protein
MEVESTNKKWVAGAGTTALGIIGTALGGLNAVNGGGLLNGLGNGNGNGKGCNETDKLRSEVAQLKAERYTDAAVIAANKETVDNLKDFYGRFEIVAANAANTSARLDCLEQKLTTYEITQREIAGLKEQLVDAKIGKVDGRIDCLADKVATGFASANNRFAAIDAEIAGFTQTVIPTTAICDTGCGCNRACGQ